MASKHTAGTVYLGGNKSLHVEGLRLDVDAQRRT